MPEPFRMTRRAVFLFALAGLSAGVDDPSQIFADESAKQAGPRANYFRDIKLQTQDGAEVDFYSDLIKGKIVVINFMYTRCEGELCTRGTKNLVRLQNALGDRL